MSRQMHLDQLKNQTFDILIIGGGINGAVAALTLSTGGFKTALIEQRDFSSYTSQESSSLAWGGIKYLESFEFGLVWGLCRSRNELLRAFPSQVKEIRFFATLEKGFRKPRLMIYLGTWLYWFMGRFFTKKPRLLSNADIQREEPQIDTQKSQGGVEYSDSYFIDTDARFVFNLVRSAIEQGSAAVNYTKAVDFSQDEAGYWNVTLLDNLTKQHVQVRARSIVNATGPFADGLNRKLDVKTVHKHVFSKGVHLIVPKITDHDRILTFFADDGRMFFVIPMMDRSCIGTTDTRVTDLPAVVTDEDRDFILTNINKRLQLARKLCREDIIAERCGVRPLVVSSKDADSDEDWINLSRKHFIEVDEKLKVISIFGGKLTDCLNVGREILELVNEIVVGKKLRAKQWPRESLAERESFYTSAAMLGVDKQTQERIWRRFLHRAPEVLELFATDPSMKQTILAGSSLTKAEVVYMASHEMIVCLEDFLRRRTGLAMKFSKTQLMNAEGIREMCQLLFGDQAELAFQEYFGETAGKILTASIAGRS